MKNLKQFCIFTIFVMLVLSHAISALASETSTQQRDKISVKHKDFDGATSEYYIEGMFDGKEMADGSEVIITTQRGDTVISGIYHDNTPHSSYIDGIMTYVRNDRSKCRLSGSFTLITGDAKHRSFISKKKRKWDKFELRLESGRINPINMSVDMGGYRLITKDDGKLYTVFTTPKTENQIAAIVSDMSRGLFSFEQLYDEKSSMLRASHQLAKKFLIRGRDVFLSYNGQMMHLSKPKDLDNAEVLFGDIDTPSSLLQVDNLTLLSDMTIRPKGSYTYTIPDSTIVSGVFTGSDSFKSAPNIMYLINNSKNHSLKWSDSDGELWEYDKWLEIPQWSDDSHWYEILKEAKSPSDAIAQLNEYISEHNIAEQRKAEEKQRKEDEEKHQQEQAYQHRIKKYQQKYGEKFCKAIAEKKLMIGMTKAMVKEFIPAECYVVTQRGNSETWTFSEKKAEMSLMSSKNGAEILMTTRMLGMSIGSLVRAGNILGVEIPLVIRFTNGKVSSVTR